MQIALKCPETKMVWGLGSCGISNLQRPRWPSGKVSALGPEVRDAIPLNIRRALEQLQLNHTYGGKRPPVGVVRKLIEGDASSDVILVIWSRLWTAMLLFYDNNIQLSYSLTERGTLVTFAVALSEIGKKTQPVFSFPRENVRGHFLEGTARGSAGCCNLRGWMKDENFIHFDEHFN
ncbi:hypothetical protein AVEN_96573-1 [Araneus ventricosus]|uniref:Uncharacterized protein n=1 Tax=Araneus ventricosus TaxID=182803 RepID=A0A4Y2HA90_ARAVE|nr:hypothetical protein AVEN_96573-1 [Araneus ventricosus]